MVDVNVYRYGAVTLSVAITVGTALLLRGATSIEEASLLLAGLLVCVVIALNVGKFLLWGWLNNKYDLSKTYPLTVIFFPLIYVISHYVDGTPFNSQKTIAVIVIICGLLYFEKGTRH